MSRVGAERRKAVNRAGLAHSWALPKAGEMAHLSIGDDSDNQESLEQLHQHLDACIEAEALNNKCWKHSRGCKEKKYIPKETAHRLKGLASVPMEKRKWWGIDMLGVEQ